MNCWKNISGGIFVWVTGDISDGISGSILERNIVGVSTRIHEGISQGYAKGTLGGISARFLKVFLGEFYEEKSKEQLVLIFLKKSLKNWKSLIPVKIPEGICEGIPEKVLNESQEEYLREISEGITRKTFWKTLGGTPRRIYWETLEEYVKKSFNRVPEGFF